MNDTLRTYGERFFGLHDHDYGPGPARTLFRILLGTLVFLLPFSLIFVPFRLLPGMLAWMSAASIVLYGMAVLFSELRLGSAGTTLARFAVIACLFFFIEWAGVSSGFPFGVYTYTDRLAPTFAGVPLAMAFAWYTVLITSWRIAQSAAAAAGFWRNTGVITLGAALLATALDLLLEPMAAFVHDYWRWSGGSVPLQNYAAWFLLSAAAVLLLEIHDRLRNTAPPALPHTRSAAILYVMQVLVFVVSALVAGHVAETVLALALIAALLAPQRKRLASIHRSIGS
ncbi:MAG: carotenoid biosynthesis protein [Ignavibacteriae bacterium]|nr:carotenoid biosynthesis protein [Ignavibacteriota bacterium]